MTVVIYEPDNTKEPQADSEPPAECSQTDAATLRWYLLERRRALITELRKVEEMLGLPQSVPLRGRPH